jgi:hypothetical protein
VFQQFQQGKDGREWESVPAFVPLAKTLQFLLLVSLTFFFFARHRTEQPEDGTFFFEIHKIQKKKTEEKHRLTQAVIIAPAKARQTSALQRRQRWRKDKGKDKH